MQMDFRDTRLDRPRGFYADDRDDDTLARITPTRAPATLLLDPMGRAVAAARVAGEITRYRDCGDTFRSWLYTDIRRLLRHRGEP